MAKSRGRIIDDDVTEVILHILDGWKGKLTWDALIKAIKASISTEYTRQALAGHARISNAFTLRKGQLANENGKPLSGNSKVNALTDTATRLKAENTRLKAEVNNYREMFLRWTANAHMRGLTSEMLDAPLGSVDRGQSKD